MDQNHPHTLEITTGLGNNVFVKGERRGDVLIGHGLNGVGWGVLIHFAEEGFSFGDIRLTHGARTLLFLEVCHVAP
jgi:hypothetical protein